MTDRKNVKLLDCTLREAPIENVMWGEKSLKRMIKGLAQANIDIIECGFLKDAPHMWGSASFQRVEDLKPYIKNKNCNVMYAALVDYGRYSLEYLSPYDGTSVDLIRICFKKSEITDVLDYAEAIRAKGYKVAIQHVDTLGYSDEEICDFVDKVNQFKPLSYSIVDTFGAMYQDDMMHFCQLVDARLDQDIALGFHAHNNLMLADANAQAFLRYMSDKCREVIVDTSLFGCGRGAGNAHTELMVQYINSKFEGIYNLDEILDLIDTIVAKEREKVEWGYSIPYFVSGMHNAHSFNVKQLMKRHNIKSKDLRGIIERLDEKQKKEYDYSLLEKLYVEYFNNPINDSEVLNLLTQRFSQKKVLLLAPGKSVIEKKDIIDSFIRENEPIIIGVNNIIEGYIFDYLFYSGIHRYQMMAYEDLNVYGNPRVIVTSNVKNYADENEFIVDYISLIKFGWINLDSSIILLLRLLIKCGVEEVYIAGLDGYKDRGNAFYKDELDTGLAFADRLENTNDNKAMLKDIKESYPKFGVSFITDSVYANIFE